MFGVVYNVSLNLDKANRSLDSELEQIIITVGGERELKEIIKT